MADKAYQGQRLSFDGELCTVRWVGSLDGKQGLWRGVEWDNPSKGKHNGSHNGKRYFDCLSKEPNAASFIRKSRPSDPPRDFFTAMGVKYGSTDPHEPGPASDAIYISGIEVDFDLDFMDRTLVRERQSVWPELQIISLDGLRLNGICSEMWSQESRRLAYEQVLYASFQCEELDLSRNLFETWEAVLDICCALSGIEILTLNGNRFKNLRLEVEESDDSFVLLKELSVARTGLDWTTVEALCTQDRFPTLQTLVLAFNPLGTPVIPLLRPFIRSLTKLDLTSCGITSLQALVFVSKLPNLLTLVLHSNPLATLSTNPVLIFPTILNLDLTATLLAQFSDLSPIPGTFPFLTSLKTSQTPLATTHNSSRLLTIARLRGLKTLNNTDIPDHERLQGELLYHNLITSLLHAAETPEQEQAIISQHEEWDYLCTKHGVPESLQQKRTTQTQSPHPDEVQEYPPMSLGAHLCAFTFHTSVSDLAKTPVHQTDRTIDIPTLIDIYALKGIVGRFYSLPPMSLRLIHETEEWDPIPVTKPSENDWSCSEDEDSEEDEAVRVQARVEREERKKKRWARREVELADSTRKVEEWVEGKKARVRVEVREFE